MKNENMSKHKLTIDLSGVETSDKQLKEIQKAISKALTTQIRKICEKKNQKKETNPKSLASRSAMADTQTQTTNITATVFNADPGRSEIKADHNGFIQTLDQSGTITFNGVSSGDIILIDVDSLGTTTVTIDVSADPMFLSFGPGNGDGQFFIN